jgi:hypothetical protein
LTSSFKKKKKKKKPSFPRPTKLAVEPEDAFEDTAFKTEIAIVKF